MNSFALRPWFAAFLLALIFGSGAVECLELAVGVLEREMTVRDEDRTASNDDRSEEAVWLEPMACHGSAESHETKRCGCPKCDEACPGGSLCKCDSHGRELPAGGVFFVAPPCHPGDGVTAALMPASIGFQFLVPDQPGVVSVDCMVDANFGHSPSVRIPHWASRPSSPPPRMMDAVS